MMLKRIISNLSVVVLPSSLCVPVVTVDTVPRLKDPLASGLLRLKKRLKTLRVIKYL